MTTTILHVSDTLYDEMAREQDLALAGLVAAIDQARSRCVDAVLHTGNFFQRPTPDSDAIEEVATELEALTDAGIEFYVVPGKRDLAGSKRPVETFVERGLATRLGTEPTQLNDEVALYGLPHEDDESFSARVSSGDVSLGPSEGRFYHILCTHQTIWPPYSQDDATVSAFDVMNGIDGWIDSVAAGGAKQPRSWHSDQVDYHVFYPGTTNPGYIPPTTDPQGFLYTVQNREDLGWQRIPLTASEPTEELDQLRSFLMEYESSSLEGAGVETLADLYALLAEGKSMLDDRRKVVRDMLIEQTAADSSIRGSIGEVYHQEYTRRSLKDDDAVFAVLDEYGISPGDITKEQIDEDRLEEAVEEAGIPTEEVFDEETVSTARKGDIELSPD